MAPAFRFMTGLGLAIAIAVPLRAQTQAVPPQQSAWVTPDIDRLPDDAMGRAIRHGRDLVARTYALIGPEVSDPAHRFAGNNLACQSCHLEAGTKQFGLPFRGVYADFPAYIARSGAVDTIEDRIQGCMLRSMNGKALPPASPEMTALVAYMRFLSEGRPVGAPTDGRGAGHIPELSRPADTARGQAVYAQTCAICHGAQGQGRRAGAPGDAKGYVVPPLWGADSFNDGAGMDRLITAANFIHANMPNGATWQTPVLTDQDAWDVSAYVLAKPRPAKADLARDYPVLTQKPVDAGYAPYPDAFPQAQHRIGPFAPIRAALAALPQKTAE
jgi:thiosulfate dehydrogenase